jgi:DNA-binding response OmpR family regulator
MQVGMSFASALADPAERGCWAIGEWFRILPGEHTLVGDRRLLVIDDEPVFCEFVRRVAEAEGFEVAVASDGDSFKQAYLDCEPAAIILDLVMPDVEGIELLQYLASQGCRSRIFIVSGYSPEYPRLAKAVACSRGMTNVEALAKPIKAGQLRAALASLSA